MKPLRHRNGNQYLYREWDHYRDQVHRKIHAYHALMQAGIIAQCPALVSLGRVSQAGFGRRSAAGSESFVRAFHHRNLSSVT
jgi:hypothetical protein